MKTDVFIVAAQRTPIGSFLGELSEIPATKLGTLSIQAALQKANLDPSEVEAVYMGCVLTAALGQAPARQAAIGAGISSSTPCATINKVCGSGLKAIALGMQEILLGERHCVVVGGMENMSQSPYYLPRARQGYKMGHQKLVDGMIWDGLWDPYNDFHMGNAAELCAKEFQFTRELQDAYAIESFKRAQNAIQQNKFVNEIISVGDVKQDEGPFKAKFEKIPNLKPVFDKAGTITAANASTINDGAAAVVLASGDFVQKYRLKPLARIVAYAEHAQNPEWFTTAPVKACESVLKKSGWTKEAVSLWEINEAFAVVAMAARQKLEISPEKLNVHGGAISLGHPIGASGARLVVTLVNNLNLYSKNKGVASLCIGGGEANAISIEKI